jgi:hypothetical protein
LQKGVNVLLLKVAHREGDWGACARFVDASGRPLPGLRVRLAPE